MSEKIKKDQVIDIPTSSECSTIIVGKDASKTGHVIVGHNEDDLDVVVLPYVVPRMKHQPGEMLYFEEGRAMIPQVEETYAYYWSEMRASTWKVSFSDSFMNEWGVGVVSNSCNPSKDEVLDPPNEQIGYGIRRLVAERAKTAREGVELAIELIEKYGYFSNRTYSICDKNEGWALQINKGKHYVAKRVPDDEVMYIPNWYTIHNIDFNDTEHKNYYFAKDLVSFAIAKGWYTPAKENDYSDFDFANAYQAAAGNAGYNIFRGTNAWRLLLGEEPKDIKLFSAKLNRKFGLDDVKALMRFHYEGTPDDYTDGKNYCRNPHADYYWPICTSRTAEGCIFEFNEVPALSCIWRTTLNPCTTLYVPWYLGNTKVPDGYNWYTPLAGQVTHFNTPASDNEFNPAWAFWTFQTLMYFAALDYKRVHDAVEGPIKEIEAAWVNEKPIVEKTYLDLLAVNPEMAVEYLTEYTNSKSQYAWDWAKKMIRQIGEAKFMENLKWEPEQK